MFCHDTVIVYWTGYRDIYNTFTYASTNMGKDCLQLVLTLLLLFSAYARQFSEQTDEKNPCWVVFSVTFKMADTNTCVLPMSAAQTSELTSKTRGNTLFVLLLCNVSYCDNSIGIRIIYVEKVGCHVFLYFSVFSHIFFHIWWLLVITLPGNLAFSPG